MWIESGLASNNGPFLANRASRSSLFCEDQLDSSANGSALASDPLLSVQAKSFVTEAYSIERTDKEEEPLKETEAKEALRRVNEEENEKEKSEK